MIKDTKVLVNINLRNITYYKNLGYLIDNFDIKKTNEILVDIKDISHSSKTKINCICEICSKEFKISIVKYYLNKNRNDKGYYSCFGCKDLEKQKTCLKKYGVKSYSQTDEFKDLDNIKWKWIGIRKGKEKGEKTMMERYGVDSFFKTDIMKDNNRKWMSSDEFKEKSKETLIEKYGVDRFSKTEEFKKVINSKKDLINEKIRQTFLEKYGVDSFFKTDEFKKKAKDNYTQTREKSISTCMEKYGVDNVSKVEEIYRKSYLTKVKNNTIIPDEKLDKWILYKRIVTKLTNRNKKLLYENWDGIDYYDDEFIKGYFCHVHTHRFYPTIDHKISTYYGFNNNIPPSEIADISNLCITKRFINSLKKTLIESDFNI